MSNKNNRISINKLRIFCSLHINADFEVVYVKKGTVTVGYDNDSVEVKAGEALLIFPYHLHGFSQSDDSDCLIIMFPATAYSDFLNKYNTRPGKQIFKITDSTKTYLNQLINECEESYNEFCEKALFYSFANLYLSANPSVSTKTFKPDVVAQAVEYIYDNLSTQLNLEDIAKHIGISPRVLSLKFAEKCGIKLIDLIGNIRTERAISLLNNSDSNITEIAESCGFGSLRNFNRVFKEKVGMSPSEYRKMP